MDFLDRLLGGYSSTVYGTARIYLPDRYVDIVYDDDNLVKVYDPLVDYWAEKDIIEFISSVNREFIDKLFYDELGSTPYKVEYNLGSDPSKAAYFRIVLLEVKAVVGGKELSTRMNIEARSFRDEFPTTWYVWLEGGFVKNYVSTEDLFNMLRS